MARVFFDVDDLDEVLDSFKEMKGEARSILHTAVNEGAAYLMPLIQRNIPISNIDDVHLRNGIKISKAKVKKSIKQTAIIRISGKKTDYGFHVETGSNGATPKPFMRRTTDDNQEQVADVVGNEIFKGLGL